MCSRSSYRLLLLHIPHEYLFFGITAIYLLKKDIQSINQAFISGSKAHIQQLDSYMMCDAKNSQSSGKQSIGSS